jgi:hypothetical protein
MKRSVSILLALVMCLGMLPLSALAIEDKWKFMKLEASEQQQAVITESNYSID